MVHDNYSFFISQTWWKIICCNMHFHAKQDLWWNEEKICIKIVVMTISIWHDRCENFTQLFPILPRICRKLPTLMGLHSHAISLLNGMQVGGPSNRGRGRGGYAFLFPTFLTLKVWMFSVFSVFWLLDWFRGSALC
jgi:hypothetical protein